MQIAKSQLVSQAPCRPWVSQLLFVVGLSLGVSGHAASASPYAFTLTSPDLSNGVFDEKLTLNGFGCKGGNASSA